MQHIETETEWTTWVDMYLGVYNDSGVFTLPPKANVIYQGQSDPTSLFTRMALQILGEMYVRRMPISIKFKEMLGPAYASNSEGEESEEESEEFEGESEESDDPAQEA